MLCFVFFLLGTRICCLSSLSLDRAYLKIELILIFTLCKSHPQIMNGSWDKNEIMGIRRSVISSDFLLIFSISNLICKIWNEISNSFLWTRFLILSVSEIISNYCYSFCNPGLQKMKHLLLFYFELLIVLRRSKDKSCRSCFDLYKSILRCKKSTKNQFWWLIFCSDLKHEILL